MRRPAELDDPDRCRMVPVPSEWGGWEAVACDCTSCRERYRQGKTLAQADASERTVYKAALWAVICVLAGVVLGLVTR